jgi:NADPH-dependent ferric siderophore reductase
MPQPEWQATSLDQALDLQALLGDEAAMPAHLARCGSYVKMLDAIRPAVK